MSQFNLPNSTREFVEAVREQLQSLTLVYKFLQIIVGAIFPIFEGFLASKASAEQPQALVIVLLVAISLIHIVLLSLLVSTEKPLSQFLVEFDSQNKELEIREEEIYVLDSYSHTFRTAVNASSLSLVGIETITTGITTEVEYKPEDIFKAILDPWIQSRTDIFWFDDGDAMYNIAVYLFNREEEILEVSFRQCDDRIQPKNRKWAQGVGHVGLCYAKGENVFCEDITTALLTTNSQIKRPEDKIYYKSVIAEPIMVEEQKEGVFIVTSSKPNQFDEDIHVPCVRVIAQLLGLGYQLIK